MSSYAGFFGESSFKMDRRAGRPGRYASVILAAFIILATCSTALCQSAPQLQSQVIGDLSLTSVTTDEDHLEIIYADSVSFRVPLDAGYLIYERMDSRGIVNLCLAQYSSRGMDFELMVNLFPLEMESVTPLDMMARGLLFAGSRAHTVRSDNIEIAGQPGIDITVSGISYGGIIPRSEIRMVFLTNFDLGVTFTLIEHEHSPQEHANAMNNILSTLEFTSQWRKDAIIGQN